MTQHEASRQVEPGLRLIQDEQIRIVQQRGDDQDLLFHALGVPLIG